MSEKVAAAERLRLASASDQARAITEGLISSEVLMQSELIAYNKLNPTLNAYILREETQSKASQCSHSPLAGTSFAVKDNFDAIGLPTRSGLKCNPDFPAKEDAVAIQKLKMAGLIFNGKLNMSPMALGSSTHNDDYGHCYNPLRIGFSAGGSSGGSASAVAAGLAGIALGSDTMGSVRLPAAFCGVVGFKPGWGQIPTEGLVPLCRQLDHVGILCRSVEDASAAFGILRNRHLHENSSIDSQQHAQPQAEVSIEPGKIGVVQNTDALGLQPSVQQLYLAACQNLANAGFTLVPIDPNDWQLSAVRRAGLLLCEAELLVTLDGIYPELSERLPGNLVAMLAYAEQQSPERFDRAATILTKAKKQLLEVSQSVGALVLPTCAYTAFSMTEAAPVDLADLTVIANVLGAPAISLPMQHAPDALPTGLQIVGHQNHDDALLNVAAQVEPLLCRAE